MTQRLWIFGLIFFCAKLWKDILEPLNCVLIFYSQLYRRFSSVQHRFNFKWSQRAFALFWGTKGRKTIAACCAENCLVCFPALPLSNIIIIKLNKKVCLKTGGIKNITSHWKCPQLWVTSKFVIINLRVGVILLKSCTSIKLVNIPALQY